MLPMRKLGFVAGIGLLGAIVLACTTNDSKTSEVQDAAPSTPQNDGAVSSSDSAAPADASDGAATCSLPGEFGSADCHACLRATCCGVITTCAGDPECLALLTCTQGCLDDPDIGDCMGQCHVDHPQGEELYTPVETCITSDPDGCAIPCSG